MLVRIIFGKGFWILDRLLTIKDVSDFLQVNERTIHRLIQANKIPATKVGNQWRFHPAQLEVWFLNGGEQEVSNGSACAPWLAEEEFRIVSPDRVLLNLDARSPSAALEPMVDTLVASGHLLQKPIFLRELIRREELMSTGVGNGVALPHAWHPINDLFHAPLVVAARLKTPIDFRAVDQEPVDLIFLLCAPRNRVHLKLLSAMAIIAKDIPLLNELRRSKTPMEFSTQLHDILSPVTSLV